MFHGSFGMPIHHRHNRECLIVTCVAEPPTCLMVSVLAKGSVQTTPIVDSNIHNSCFARFPWALSPRSEPTSTFASTAAVALAPNGLLNGGSLAFSQSHKRWPREKKERKVKRMQSQLSHLMILDGSGYDRFVLLVHGSRARVVFLGRTSQTTPEVTSLLVVFADSSQFYIFFEYVK